MSIYNVVLSKTAEKHLSKLPPKIIALIITELELLGKNPRPKGCKKLKGFSDL